MPKVIVNAPKPVTPPPTTYNLELTEAEFLALRSLVARRDLTSVRILEPLSLQMWAVSQKTVSPFKIEKSTRALGAYHIRMKTAQELEPRF